MYALNHPYLFLTRQYNKYKFLDLMDLPYISHPLILNKKAFTMCKVKYTEGKESKEYH